MFSIKQNKLLPTHDYEMYKEITKSRGQTELNFKRIEPMKPITSDFNVPNSDDEIEVEETNTHEKTPPSSETDNDDGDDDDEHLSVLDAKHPKYLETFLKRSRLHYLSSTAIAKKVYVQDLRQKPEHRQTIEKFREELKTKLQRTERDYLFKFNEKDKIYMHIDMDCFFVSVATRNQPELRDQPIAITHSKGKKPSTTTTTNEQQFYSRSEIASCNYAARQYGIRNGMYLGITTSI